MWKDHVKRFGTGRQRVRRRELAEKGNADAHMEMWFKRTVFDSFAALSRILEVFQNLSEKLRLSVPWTFPWPKASQVMLHSKR